MAIAAVTLLLLTFAIRVTLISTRTFDPDEFQHLHGAAEVHAGRVPYRDFFEHHMPSIHYLVALGLGPWSGGPESEDLIALMLNARWAMSVIAILSLALTIRLGADAGGPAVGWLSGAFLTTSVVFMSRSIEIRPDVPALAAWIAYLIAIGRAVVTELQSTRRAWLFTAGLALGVGLTLNQKLLLAGPGIAAWAIGYLTRRDRWNRAHDIAALAVGTLIPVASLWEWFVLHGAGRDLIVGTITNNLGWPREVSPQSTLRWMLLRDPWLSGLVVTGVAGSALAVAADERRTPQELAWLLPVLSLLAGLMLTPAAYPQYLLLVLPLGTALGSRELWRLLTVTVSSERSWASDTGVLLGSLTAVLGLATAKPYFRHWLAYPAFVASIIILTIWMRRRRQPSWAAVLSLIMVSVYSLQQLRWMQGLSNAEQLQQIRWIAAHTAEDDKVLDGFTGVGWFLGSASRYPFLHGGVRARLSPGERIELAGLVQHCNTAPRIVILDDSLKAITADIVPAVVDHYDRTPFAPIWIRKDRCLD